MEHPTRDGNVWRGRRIARVLPVASALLFAVTAAACGSSSSSTTTTPRAAGAGGTTTTTAALPSTTTSTTVVTAVACPTAGSGTICEFYSPTKKVECQIDTSSTLCLTVDPPRSVTLGPGGTYTTCTGESCLSNAGVGTGTLAYGTSTSIAPFACTSRPTGMTCTASGRGFTISTAGIVDATA
jgi:hypothetical protein